VAVRAMTMAVIGVLSPHPTWKPRFMMTPWGRHNPRSPPLNGAAGFGLRSMIGSPPLTRSVLARTRRNVPSSSLHPTSPGIGAHIDLQSDVPPTMTCSYRFSALSGFFVDNVIAAIACLGGKLTTRPNLGLLDRQYDSNQTSDSLPWVRFRQHVDALNKQSLAAESYKVLYLARHGLSVHNIVMEEVGGEAWNVGAFSCYYLFVN